MANTSNSNYLSTDLNLDPYNDDFENTKNFYRTLFRPGFAVQARELTQIQTVLQNQVGRFADHVFRNGSVVLPGHFNIETDLNYVMINDLDSIGNEVDVDDFKGLVLTGQTTGITAIVTDVLDGVQTNTNKKTLYVRYTSASPSDGTTKVFADGEILLDPSGNSVVVFATNATGYASKFSITEGVIYAKNHFIWFPTQSIIIGRYSVTPSVKVGFIVEESIITPEDDQSLLDPALGSTNYAAPGAHRLKLYPSLETYSYDAEESRDFVKLFSMKEGVIEETYERSQYAILRDELAKRTFDESGDYYVRGLGTIVREHLDDGSNFGYSNTGNNQLLAVGVQPGLGYIKGYEVNKLVTDWTLIEKGLTFENVNSQIITSTMGNYLTVDECVGAWNLDEGTQISLYDTAQNRISTKGWSTASQTGNSIGTARIKGIEYQSGIQGTANAKYSLYLFDVKMTGSNSFSNVKSVYYNNSTTADMGADVVLSSNNAVLEDSASNPLLYYVGSKAIRTIRDNSGSPDTTFTFKRSEDVTIASNGTFTISISIGSEQTPYGTGTLSDASKRELILNLNENKSITLSGTVSAANGSTTLNGSGTDFTKLNVGDKIEIGGTTGTYFVSSITNATSLIVSSGLVGSAISGNTVSKVYKNGDIIDLTNKGATGVEVSVTSTSTTLSFDLKESFGSTVSATLNYPVSRTSAREVAKTLRSNRYVKINVASANTVAGAYNLGFSDVYRIKEIRKHSAPFSSATDGSNVTSLFTWTNGQKDDMYDFATITPKTALVAGDHLLVKLDYFIPDFTQGVGYFSVDSYPVDDTQAASNTTIRTENIPIYRSPVSGIEYNLRNYLDFRPVKTITAADSTTVAGATTNPGVSSGFESEANGLRIPQPSSQVIFDYSYYLPRRDLIAMDFEGRILSITGTPASYPVTPTAPENLMVLSKIYVAPYPSLSPAYAQNIQRKDLACTVTKEINVRHTMRDIGVIKQRVNNLENYVSLNILERNALDLRILDENGLDRFKNGIFADTFANHKLGATYNPDYQIVVDPKEKSIRPVFTMDSVYYGRQANTNVVVNKNLATLSYTEVPYITQPRVTTTRNTEVATYKYVGNLYLTPETDVWVDTETLPDESIIFGSGGETAGDVISREWNQWQSTVVGYNIYNTRTGALIQTLGGTLTLTQATNAARTIAAGLGFDVDLEVETENSRTGIEQFELDGNSERIGNRIVDVSIEPFIRPQIIHIYARGLKPKTRFYTYFDGEDMSEYVTPYSPTSETQNLVYEIINSETGAMSPFDPEVIELNIDGTMEGNNFISTANGEIFGLLRIPPEKKFRNGTKRVELVDSPTNASDDITTYGVDYFVSQGMIQQQQGTIISTRPGIGSREIEERQRVTNITRISPPTQPQQPGTPIGGPSPDGGDRGGDGSGCMAYSFIVRAPENAEGAFITSVDLYFAGKDDNLGVWFEILEMDNAGGITKIQVPFSEVWLKTDQVQVSDNASVATRVTFPAPVFLTKDVEYAFAIHPEALNPNYYLWVSRLGETDILTGEKVNGRPYTGTLYMTNNGLNWDIVNGVDLTMVVNRASFTSNTNGTLVLGNKPIEKLLVANTTSTMTRYGEPIYGGDKLTLSSITGGTIVVGDIIIDPISNANSSVIAIDGSTYTMSNSGYRIGSTANVYFSANMVSRGITANISGKTTATGVLRQYTSKGGNVTIKLTGSNGHFFTGDTIRGRYSLDSATVEEIKDFRYSVVDFEPEVVTFNYATCTWEMQTTANTGTKGNYFGLIDNNNYYFAEEQVLYSRTNEIANLSGAPSNNVRATLRTTTDWVSPIVDLGRTHSIYIDNIVNSNTTGETSASGGGLINKYISRIVTLADGQDAEDLKVLITAYRPPSTEVKIYAKILNNEDGASSGFESKDWIELEYLDDTIYSSIGNRNDFKEYTFKFPAAYLTGPNGEVQYTNEDGTTFTGFKYFQIKIGLSATNSAVVPRVADLRAIALQI